VHIHASAEELNRVYQADLAINAACAPQPARWRCWLPPSDVVWDWPGPRLHADYVANLLPAPSRTLPADTEHGMVDMHSVIATVQKHLPVDAVLTNGAGNFASWLHRFYRYSGLAKGFKTQLAPTNGAMGYGVPAGIAAAITARPGRSRARVVFTIAQVMATS
jgi:acetolactate synthase-1/2/3 large subunit